MFQSEAMLLLLILAVLGTPSFSAETYYGTTTGTPFCTSIPEGQNLMGIRVYVRNGIIMGIQVKYGDDNWDDIHGNSNGTPVTMQMESGEHIISASGTFGTYINQMIFITTRPRDMMAGSRIGRNEYTESPDRSDQVLTGICGFHTKGGLKAVKFVWRKIDDACPE